MAPGERQEWTGHVCGLSLKKQYGQFARLTTNYDTDLLSVLYDAQTLQPQSGYTGYCPLRRSFRATVIVDENQGVRYAASIALMMAASKIKDHIQDNETGWRYIQGIATAVADRWMGAAGKTAAALGFAAERIESQVRCQTEIESRSGRGFSFYSAPTELAVGAAFEHTAVLSDRPDNRGTLYATA